MFRAERWKELRHAAMFQTSWGFLPCLCADIDNLQHCLRTQDIVQLLHLKWYQLIKGSKLSQNCWLWRGFNQSAPAFAPTTNGQSSENFEKAGMRNQNAGHQDRRKKHLILYWLTGTHHVKGVLEMFCPWLESLHYWLLEALIKF